MKLKNKSFLKVVYFHNGPRGKYILKKIDKIKFITIKNIIVIRKELINDEKIIKFKKKYIYIKKINSNTTKKKLSKINADLFILSGFPIILKEKIFKLPKIMAINLHGGPLPKYRGGSPLNWQIINMEKKIGISIIKVNKGIDTGSLLGSKSFRLLATDDIKSVHQKANKYFFILLKSILTKIKNKNLIETNQKKAGKFRYWHQRSDYDGNLNFANKTAREVNYFVKALTKPYPGAWIKLDKNKMLRVYKIKILRKNFLKKKGEIKKIKNYYYIKTKDKTCKILNFNQDYLSK